MTTASDIITRAARALGYLGRTEVMSAGDINDGLTSFNALLDSWTNSALMSYVILQRSFPLVAGQQTYTIGSGGDVNSDRPYDISSAFLRDANHNDYPMTVIPRIQWDHIGQKQITSQIPTVLFYDSQYPLGIINVFPVPLINYTCFFNTNTNQVTFSTLLTTLSMPLGYERCFVMNLALELMSNGFPCMLDGNGLSMLMNNATDAMANIKRANMKEELATYDPAVVSHSDATYNIYSDGNTSRG